MRDEELRKEALDLLTKTKAVNHLGSTQARRYSYDLYIKVIALFSRINSKIESDYFSLAEANHMAGNCCFNTPDYQTASTHYLASVAYLLQTQDSDEKFRHLIYRYIDLSDSYCELHLLKDGSEAMANAISAFTLIANKTADEKKIGDPQANLDAFKNFYEKELSANSYLTNQGYINSTRLLAQETATNALTSALANVAVDPVSGLINGLEALHYNSEIKNFTIQFTPLTSNEDALDQERRQMARQLLNLAQNYSTNNQSKESKATCTQALDALKSIEAPNQNDRSLINQLETRLKESVGKNPFSFYHPPTHTRAFCNNPDGLNNDDDDFSDSMELG